MAWTAGCLWRLSPLLADEPAKTLNAAKQLCASADRPNLFIKIPGTPKGLSAIEDAIFAGIPVNVTLIFSRDQYLEAASAYMRGIERRIKAGLNPAVHSVASIFISRWDKAIAGKARRCLRRSRELAQWCSVEVTRFGNRIGNGNGGRGIIHAEGVRGDFLSSAPQARTAPGMATWLAARRAVALPGLGEPVDLVA